ncbi:unnamed protein product [Allacma fusca]|uniref:Uncharacterized protein n=1 Tax=Allacma fusca TaxID=39272 RepID=A0A8J2L5V9_9HEXA|nr:unnamed protein product [Allacma fusca]
MNRSEETRRGIRAAGPNANSTLNLSTTNTRMESCIGSIPGSSLQTDEARKDLIQSLSGLLLHLKERTESRCELDAAAQKCAMFTKAMFPTDVKAAMGEDKFEQEELNRNRFANVSECTTSGENNQ